MGWTQEEVRQAVRRGSIVLKIRRCPTDKDRFEVYVTRDNRVVMIGSPEEAEKYIAKMKGETNSKRKKDPEEAAN